MVGLAGLFVALAMQSEGALQKGLMDLRGGRYEQARTELEEATRVQPENAFSWVALAEVCRRLNDNERADAAAGQAEKLGGSQPPVEHALAMFYAGEGQYGRAAKWEEQYAGSAKADGRALARAGGWYVQAGDDAGGERVYRTLWERAPSDPDVAFGYAQLRLRRLDFSGAAEAVAPALAAHAENAQLVLTMGVARYGQRRFDEAIEEFLKVITIDGTVPQPYEFLGKMLEQAGPRLPEIRNAFEVWAAKNPENGEAQMLLAKVRLSEDAKDGTAEALLRKATALDARNWEAHFELGVVLETKRDFRGAAEELLRACELNEKEATPHYHLARVYDRLGEPERAKAERAKHRELTGEQ